MTDLQTPLRVTSAPEYTFNRNVLAANGVFLFRAPTDEVAAEIVRRCNEFEKLHAKYIAAEQSATVALQAQTILRQADEIDGLKAKLAESEQSRDLYQREAESMENQLDRLEEAATALTPYPEGYRPTAWEAVFELPAELRKACERATLVPQAAIANPMLLPPVWLDRGRRWEWDTGGNGTYHVTQVNYGRWKAGLWFGCEMDVANFCDSPEAAQAACWQDYCERMKGAFVDRAV